MGNQKYQNLDDQIAVRVVMAVLSGADYLDMAVFLNMSQRNFQGSVKRCRPLRQAIAMAQTEVRAGLMCTLMKNARGGDKAATRMLVGKVSASPPVAKDEDGAEYPTEEKTSAPEAPAQVTPGKLSRAATTDAWVADAGELKEH